MSGLFFVARVNVMSSRIFYVDICHSNACIICSMFVFSLGLPQCCNVVPSYHSGGVRYKIFFGLKISFLEYSLVYLGKYDLKFPGKQALFQLG